MTIQQLQGYSIFSGLQICGESCGSIFFGVPYFGAFVSESSKKTWRNPVLDHCVCFLWSHHNWIAGTVPLKQSGRVQGLLVTTSADSLGCGAFPGRLLAQTKIHITNIMKPFPCWLLLEFWLYFLVTFLSSKTIEDEPWLLCLCPFHPFLPL